MTPDTLAAAEEAVRGFVSATVEPARVVVALAGVAGAFIALGLSWIWRAWAER